MHKSDPFKTVLVYSNCHRNFTDKKKPGLKTSVETEFPTIKKSRSNTAPFNWKNNCFLCAKPVIMDSRHPQRHAMFAQSIVLQSFRMLLRMSRLVGIRG